MHPILASRRNLALYLMAWLPVVAVLTAALISFFVLIFSELRRNTALDERLFRFEPPPGVDVIGDAGP